VVQARVIATDYSIPSQFLGQILQQLRAAGLISSSRGSSGGFRLALPPEQITVGDIVEATCPSATSASPANNTGSPSSIVQEVWDELESLQTNFLAKITLVSLAQRTAIETGGMFFI
jgi:Rrf2 family protein